MSQGEDDPLPPLDGELQSLFDLERRRLPEPLDAQARVIDRVVASIPALSTPEGPWRGSTSKGAASGMSPSVMSPSIRWVAAVAFLAGGATFAGVNAALRHPVTSKKPALFAMPAEATVNATPPVSSLSSSPKSVAPDPLTQPSTAKVPALSIASPSVNGKPTVTAPDEALGVERAILEVARTALARGDYDGSLVELARHAQRFPRGQLTEERESLAIQALSGAGRVAEARARATQFRKRCPGSMLLPVVQAATGANQ
ncbi:MAG: hypothetical protein NVS3B20_24330 [Polyangiales bacterium]